MNDLTCDTCAYQCPNANDAMEHVRVNPAHAMTGVGEEDVTFRIEAVFDEDIVDEFDEDDDWNAVDQ